MVSQRELERTREQFAGEVGFDTEGRPVFQPGGRYIPESVSEFELKKGVTTTPEFERFRETYARGSGGVTGEVLLERERQRLLEIERQRSSAELLKEQEKQRLAEQQRQRDIALGKAIQTERFVVREGKVVKETPLAITRNIGESESAFRERARSLGAGTRTGAETPRLIGESKKAFEFRTLGLAKPEEIRRFEAQDITQANISKEIAQQSRQLSFNLFSDQGVLLGIQKQEFRRVRERRGPPIAEARGEKTAQIVGEIFTGETGKQFVGIGQAPIGITTGKPLFTGQEIKTELRKLGMPGKVIGEFIPTTPLEVLITGGAVAIVPSLPPAIRIVGGTTITGIQTKRVFEPSLAPEKRIASGISAGLIGTGTFFEVLPFIRGGIAKVSPKFQKVEVQIEGFKAIKGKTPSERIGLIEPKTPLKTGQTIDVTLPKTSPLKRGGFGVKPSEKKLFLGADQKLATSQRGLFKADENIRIEREFFVTPQEPTLKIAETRISRLGLVEPLKAPKQVEIGFGIPPKPQIGITKAGVGRIETPTSFKIGKGTELEAIKTFGTITDIQKIGVTTIKGQAVELFGFKVVKGIPTGIKTSVGVSTMPTARVSGELVLGAGLITKPTTQTTGTVTAPIITTVPISKSISTPSISIGSLGISPIKTPPTRKPTPTITKPTVGIPSLTSPPVKTPTTIPRVTKSQNISQFVIPTSMPPTKEKFKGQAIAKPTKDFFGVEIRRYGKFKSIGQNIPLPKALSLGQQRIRGGLGATFRITGKGVDKIPTPLGFRRAKQPRTFIQITTPKKGGLPGGRIGSIGEKIEIRQARRKLKKKGKRGKK